MFSPLNDLAVTDWFRRLDAAWRRMPADEQAKHREEVQQHLEGLVAAKVAAGQSAEDAWNAALVQFGNPTQVGRKLYREWKQSKTGFRAEIAAIMFGAGWYMVLWASIQIEGHFGIFGGPSAKHFSAVGTLIVYVENAAVCVMIGRKYPLQAIKSSLYSQFFMLCCSWMYLCISAPIDLRRSMAVILPSFTLGLIAHDALSLIAHAAVTYLASVTKRGWYKPTFEDFKLTLLRRRQVG